LGVAGAFLLRRSGQEIVREAFTLENLSTIPASAPNEP